MDKTFKIPDELSRVNDFKGVTELFDQFIYGSTLKSVLVTFRRICLLLDLEPGPFNQFYPTLKKGIVCNKNWKSQSIFSKIEKKAFNKIYHSSGSSSGRSSGIGGGGVNGHHHHHHSGSPYKSNDVLKNNNCLVIGGGPCGLRTAIELQLLGAHHVIITEKRDRFSRNNVLHLWPFVIADLKQLAGKKFYGKFCAGSIDHVSIRQLQLMLLKVALIIGCEFIENVTFEEICPHNIRSSRESIKETSLEAEIDGTKPTTTATTNAHRHRQQSPTKRKLYSTAEEIEYIKKGATTNDPNNIATNCDNQENQDTSNIGIANSDNNDNKVVDCSSSTSNDYHGVGKTESRRLSICSCCCHLHRSSSCSSSSSESGRPFWSHLPKNYIGAYAHFSLTSATPSTATTLVNYDLLLEKLHTYPFDILIGGDGRRNTLNDNFPRKEFRGKLAIAITANFINNHTLAEAQIPEISGISFIYHQEMFKSLYDETGIDLENICYYKDDTHYFVMTAKKSSLLQRGVLINDYSDTRALLASTNIDRGQLLAYARDAAKWTTGLDTPNFALNHYGEADVAMFDFTSMYAADNACRAMRIVRAGYPNHQHNCSRCNCDNEPCKKSKSETINVDGDNGDIGYNNTSADDDEVSGYMEGVEGEMENIENNEGLLLISLVGDSLLEPFWPTGSGCGRGFLSAMDSAWLARQWAVKKCKSILDEEKILQVLSEREAVYRLLAQTKSENLSQNCASYTINPVTRYPNLNSSTLLPHQCRHLLHDHLPLPIIEPRSKLTMAEKRARRATIATTSPFSGGTTATNGEGEIVMESRARVEREFMAISRERERTQRNNEANTNNNNERFVGFSGGRSYGTGNLTTTTVAMEDDENNLAAHREFEDSLAAFEENYRGLMASDIDPSLIENSGSQLSTSVPNRSHMHNATNFTLDLSPSASNLITMAKSRARDIESAFRHRRQHQSKFKLSEGYTHDLSPGEGGKVHEKAQKQCINHLRQQLRSKAAWFLDQKASENADNNGKESNSSLIKRESFNERIKDLEAKLYAASGLSAYLSDDNSDQGKDDPGPPIKLPSTKTGINVMMTASQLQQLFNPKFQEEKLRQEAKLKSTKDIKYVGKITKSDWNVKPFEEGTINNESSKVTNSKSKSPPPQRVELFRNKLNDIQNKLEHIDDHHQPERRGRLDSLDKGGGGGTGGGEWISMLKNELNEKATKKPEILTEPAILRRSPSIIDNPFRKEARREAAAAKSAAQGLPSSFNNKLSKSPTSPLPSGRNMSSGFKEKEKITIVERSIASKVCAKCGLIVATVDKILISGTLFHRSCLKCILCGVTLRMSEVRYTNGSSSVGSLASLITGTVTVLNNAKLRDRPLSGQLNHRQQQPQHENGFNYKCTNCSSGKQPQRVTSSASTTSVIDKLMGNRYDGIKSSITSLSSAASSSSTSSGVTPTITQINNNRMTSSFDGALEPLAKSMSARLIEKMASTTDDYEVRLKERMKWKEMFLLNNDNNDLSSGLVMSASIGSVGDLAPTKMDAIDGSLNGAMKKKVNPTSSSSGRRESGSKTSEVSESFRNRLNERIEYENTSMSSQMVDDDELTKLLNLGSDHWDSAGEVDDDDEDDDTEDEDEDDNDNDEDDDESDKDTSDSDDHDDNGGSKVRGSKVIARDIERATPKSSIKNQEGKSYTKEKDNVKEDDESGDDEDGDVDDEDRQTTTSASESWDTSDSTDNDFDSDQFDESNISDNNDYLNSRPKNLGSSSSSLDVGVGDIDRQDAHHHHHHRRRSPQQQLTSKSSLHFKHHKSSVKEDKELSLPQIIVHKETTTAESISSGANLTLTNELQDDEKESNNLTEEKTITTDNTSYQPGESLSTPTSQQSSELIISSAPSNDAINAKSDSTLKADEVKSKEEEEEVDDDSDKTEKNLSSGHGGNEGSDDSDTINSKINEIDKNQEEQLKVQKYSTTPTTFEEREFQLIVNEMEKKSINCNNNMTSSKPILNDVNDGNDSNLSDIKKIALGENNNNNNMNFDSDDDTDSKTSLSSLSIAISDTYDDINLLSVWDESGGNCDDQNDLPVKSKTRTKRSTNKSSHRPKDHSSASYRKRQTLNDTFDCKKPTISAGGLFKSKTDVSIISGNNYKGHNDCLMERKGLEPIRGSRRLKMESNCEMKKSPLSSRLSSNSSSSSTSNVNIKDINYGSKSSNYSSSVDSNYNDYNETTNYTAKLSSPSKGETYSKIPVLAARVIAANEGGITSIDNDQFATINETSPTKTTGTTTSKSKYKPSYSGSFTEKLLQRCRSSPSIPLIGDALTSRWSTSKLQLSSPNKVLNLTKALNAQTVSHNNNNTISPLASQHQHQQQQSTWSKLIKSHPKQQQQREPQIERQSSSTITTKRQPSHCSLPFADSHENASSIQHQQSKQSNHSTINSSIASSLSPSSVSQGHHQIKTSPNQFAEIINPPLPRITGITIKTVNPTTIDSTTTTKSSSKLSQAPRATFDEDMFDDDDDEDDDVGEDEPLERISSSSSSSSPPSRKHQNVHPPHHHQSKYHQRHRSPTKKPANTSMPPAPESNQLKLKPIKLNYNN